MNIVNFNSSRRKLYIGIAIAVLAIILLINSITVDSALQSVGKHWLDSSIFGSKVFHIRELFELLGGLGLFLFGIKFMGEGLQLSAGEKIKNHINKLTTNPIKGLLFGIIITGLIQSSSGTTALVVALVSVGLMSFRQSMAVIIGANLGTTVTSILIGLKIQNYVWIIIAFGGLWYMFSNKKKSKYIAQTILGFGILFLGMKYMGGAMKPLAKEEWFKNMLIAMDSGMWYSRWLGMLVSICLTILVQSSSASIGIIQTLHADNLLAGQVAIPMIFGANVGTTITAVLASVGASMYAKRTALFHVVFNIVGALIFMSLSFMFVPVVLRLINGNWNSAALIPTTHVIFNICATIIFMPVLSKLEIFIKKVIKSSDKEIEDLDLPVLNKELAEQSAPLAISSTQNALGSLAHVANYQTKTVYEQFKHHNRNKAIMVKDMDLAITQYTNRVIDYLDEISSYTTSAKDQKSITSLTLLSRDITRISSLNRNLSDVSLSMIEDKKRFSEEAYKEIKVMFKLVQKIGKDLESILNEGFKRGIYKKLSENEDQINKIDVKFKRHHIKRCKDKTATKGDKNYFTEVLTRVERIADHHKIAASYLDPKHDIDKIVDIGLINELLAIED